ncbi:hypothetical protein GE21DRAFT_1037320 [Neurospora crassa]|nr:hypothetical protein GE21DRAFT_1037320 [Neurospora crassa]
MIDQAFHLQVDSFITKVSCSEKSYEEAYDDNEIHNHRGSHGHESIQRYGVNRGFFFIKRTNTLQILQPSQLTPTIPPLRKPRSERYSENSPHGPPPPQISSRESPLPAKTERKTSLLYSPIQENSKKVRKEKGVVNQAPYPSPCKSHPTKERSMSRNSSLPADGRG